MSRLIPGEEGRVNDRGNRRGQPLRTGAVGHCGAEEGHRVHSLHQLSGSDRNREVSPTENVLLVPSVMSWSLTLRLPKNTPSPAICVLPWQEMPPGVCGQPQYQCQMSKVPALPA